MASDGGAEHQWLFRKLGNCGRKLAWHAGEWRNGRWKMPLSDARRYVELLPLAILKEHARIDAGARPPYPKLTESYVAQLVDKPPPGGEALR